MQDNKEKKEKKNRSSVRKCKEKKAVASHKKRLLNWVTVLWKN